MEGIQLTVVDQESILYLVHELDNIEKDKAIRSGLSAGANFFKKGGVSRLKQRMKKPGGVTGNLLNSFTVRVKRSKLGALSGFKYGQRGGAHAWLVDLGTDERYQNKTGRRTGKGKALFFWSETRGQDYPKAVEKVREGVERFVQRINERRR